MSDSTTQQCLPPIEGLGPPFGPERSPRPAIADTRVMNFWEAIFPASMVRFTSETPEPKARAGTAHSIRDKDNWEDVYDVLDSARAQYQNQGGAVGWWDRVRRKAADNIAPVAATTKTTTKLAPNNMLSTPVVGAIEIVLDAVKKAAEVRKLVLEGLDDLTAIFAEVELFLATFQGDVNIREASIDLTVAVLGAVEKAIGFFTRNEFLRGGKAIFMAADYESDLCESLGRIQTKSANLLREAEKSHIHAMRMHSEEMQNILQQILKSQQNVATCFNALSALLAEYMHQKRQLEAAQQANVHLSIENGRLRYESRTPSPNPFSQQCQHRVPPSSENHINQSTLSGLLGPAQSIDLYDLSFISHRKSQLPTRQLARAEQVINTFPFQSWISSLSSTKLLIHWNSSSKKTSVISPLSVLCATLIGSLRSQISTGADSDSNLFVSTIWFCSLHTDRDPSEDSDIGGRAMLISMIQQMLCQHTFDTAGLDFTAAGPQASVAQLVDLLGSLVARLPEAATLYWIVDGVVLYEREEFYDEAMQAFAGLIRIVANAREGRATVKLLLSSMPGTDVVRAAFEDEGSIVEVEGLAKSVSGGMSEERMEREMR